MTRKFRPGPAGAATAAMLCVSAASLSLRAWAQADGAGGTPADLGTVSASGTRVNLVPGTPYPVPAPGTPAYVAPSRAPLQASQPTSVVGQDFISNSTSAAQNYDDLIEFTPSLANIQPAGPVSQQNYGESIRGFQYNQINTTFDGIVLPGAPSNFAPQSAAYFTSHDLGSVNVERGPGTASQIGYATFGGTVALLSKAPANTVSIDPYMTLGSFNQQLYGVEGDTGIRPEAGGGRGYLDLSRLTTNAYLTGVTTDRSNGFVRWDQPAGSSTELTFVGMLNSSYGHTAYGSTLEQITTLGRNYGLSSDPRSQAYSGYNTDIYNTDFEYLRARSDLGSGFGADETVYTASYFRRGSEGADPNGTTPNLSGRIYIDGQPVIVADDVPGVEKHNDFRDWGSITRGTYDTPFGQARAGLWFDYVANNVYRTKVDLSQGYQIYTTRPGASPYNQFYRDELTTVQPYAEFAWKPLPALTITPGVKVTTVQRDLDATVLSGAPPGKSSRSFTGVQPGVDAHYQIDPGWVAYAQISRGFLAPPLSTLQTTLPATITPETTTNYQIGTAYQNGRVALGADGYYIPFSNYITSQTTSQGTLYSNSGGATYKGLEFEGTVKVAGGLSLYGNATLNSAVFDDGAPVYQSPQHTFAAGPIDESRGVFLRNDIAYVSFLWKDVGKQYGQNSNTAGGPVAQYPIKSYTNADFSVRYTLPILNGRKIVAGFNVFNVFDNKSLVGLAGTTAGSPTLPLYWTNPGRSFFFNLTATL